MKLPTVLCFLGTTQQCLGELSSRDSKVENLYAQGLKTLFSTQKVVINVQLFNLS